MFNLKNRSAFSLIEVITVVAIIGILVTIATPSLGRYQDSLQLKNEIKKIVNELHTAQQKTITEQNKYSIKFDLAQNYYQLINESSGQIIETINLASPIILSTLTGLTSSKAIFNTIGAVDYEGTITLLHAQAGSRMMIEIQPAGYLTQKSL